MSSRVQRFCLIALLTILLGVLLVFTFSSCNMAPKTTLTREQAIALIAYSAVPYVDSYLQQSGQPALNSPVNAGGDWDAVYGKDHRTWTVKGQVTVSYPDGTKNYSTTWTLSEADGTIKLIEFVDQ